MKFQLTIDTKDATWPDGTPGLDKKLAETGSIEDKLELVREIAGSALSHRSMELVEVRAMWDVDGMSFNHTPITHPSHTPSGV